MTISHVPTTDAERATCISAIAEITLTKVTPAIAAQITGDYQPCVTAYTTARTAAEVASSAAALASLSVKTTDKTFGLVFNKWVLSIDQSVGKRTTSSLLRPELANRTPSKFLKLGHRRKADQMVDLLVHVAETPALAPDPAAVDALRTASADLTTAVTAQESALRTRATAVEAANTATTRFDGAYGLLVKALLRSDPLGIGATLPRFFRDAPGAEIPTPAPSEPTTAPDPPAPATT